MENGVESVRASPDACDGACRHSHSFQEGQSRTGDTCSSSAPCGAPTGAGASSPLLLLCAAFLVMGAAWAQDFPGSMFSFLAQRFGPETFTETENQVLYSVYSWPNVAIVALAGFAMDGPVGVHRGTILCALFAAIGQLLFSAAMQWRTYALAVLGRLVFGIGGEAIKVAQNTWIVRLSEPKDLAFRFGVVLSVPRLASASNFALTPTIGEASSEATIWLGTVTNVVSLAAALILVRGYHNTHTDTPPPKPPPTHNHAIMESSVHPRPAVSACTSLRRALVSMHTTLRSFSMQVWLQLALCMFYHVGVLLLFQVGARYLQHTSALKANSRVASLLVSIAVFIAIPGIPAAGRLVDKYGHALASICGASLLLVFAQLLLLIYILEWVDTQATSGWALCAVAWTLVGISYAVATASIWPLIPFLLPPSQIATCYGTMTSIENLGIAVISLILPYLERAPRIRDTDWQYALPLLLLILCGLIATSISAAQLYLDSTRHEGRLSKPAAQRGAPPGNAERLDAP